MADADSVCFYRHTVDGAMVGTRPMFRKRRKDGRVSVKTRTS